MNMKKILCLVVVLLLAVTCLAGCGKKDDTKLVMATNAEFPPYEYMEDGKIVGIDAEIAAEIAKKLGKELVIENVDFDSIIIGVQEGKYDFAMAGLTVTDDRKEQVDFTDTYATGKQVIIVKNDSAIATADDLFAEGANHKIGVQLATTGDLYCTWDIEDEGLGTVERYNKGADAIMALQSGKVDCVVIDNEPAKVFVQQNEGLKILETEYIIEDYAAAVGKNNPELLEQINTALKELIADGTVQKIIDEYIPAEE
ncbi:MAG: transporter substrate-binding domain-containing protein [Clostridia bacterium]|nr:transporter substrate-binding domain-containing protein [Clostridia bacterium]